MTIGDREKAYTTSMYMCHALGAGEQLKDRVTSFIRNYRDMLVSKLGFPRGWDSEPIWREGLEL